MNFLFVRSWKRAILKMRRLTLPLWCQYLLVLWAFPLLLQDVVFGLIPPTEKEQDTTDAICLQALLLAFHCEWFAHSGKNRARQFAPAVLKRSLCLIYFLR